MIKILHQKAHIVVKTPMGDTDSFEMEEIVRQGSVYGPQICIASMDKINKIGKNIRTFYSPDLSIMAVVFVDDVTGMGGIEAANNTIYNCGLMEERKKMTFNNKNGKTEYMVIGKKKEEVRTLCEQVKKGMISRVKEHKLLGSWFDETGDYGVNIKKKKESLNYMISTIKNQASQRNIGKYAIDGRIKLAESVVLQTVLYNIEAFQVIKPKEIKELESIQHSILCGILELPKTTPYCAMLMEVGWWTVKARVSYRRLMLYHNIMKSDDRRTIKKIVEEQKKETRESTWLASVKKDLEKYNLEVIDVEEVLKSTWKKEVKKKINDNEELVLREKCENSTKSRFVAGNKFEKKQYLTGLVNHNMAKKILKMRLNMSQVPGNYKNERREKCGLCQEETGNTEHYFGCHGVSLLRKVWGAKVEDIRSLEIPKMKIAANFIEKVEDLEQPASFNWRPLPEVKTKRSSCEICSVEN